MNVGIITDSIRKKSTGIGFYTKSVTAELLKMDNKNHYYFLDFLQTPYNKDRLIKIANPFKFFKTYLWHNYLPFKTGKLPVDYVFNFSACPHFFPFQQKEIFFVYDISWYLYPECHPESRIFFYKLFFKKTLNNCYKIVTDSLCAKKDLITVFHIPENKISVIYPPFSDTVNDVKNIKFSINFPYILFIGTIEPRKNIASLIKAFKKLKTGKIIHHKLIICGKKGWLYNHVFTLIKTLHLQEDVLYLGYITDEEKKYLYKHADCFVFPSLYEGFGIPVQEAINYGCPVITSNVSSLPEVIGKAGITVNPHDIDALASAMKILTTDEKVRSTLREEGYKQAKKLSNTEQIHQLLNEVLKIR